MTSLKILFLLFIIQIFSVYSFDFGMNLEDSFFDIQVDRDRPDKLYKEFEDFMVKYKREYKDDIEKKFRFERYVESHNHVQKLNNKASQLGHDTKYGINKFSDRTKSEMNQLFSPFEPKHDPSIPVIEINDLRVKRQMDNLPKNFDLRNKKVGGRHIISEVKNQDHCSACWAFSAAGLAEIALSVHLKKLMILSDQELCDCAAIHRVGCAGGVPDDGLQYIKTRGLSAAAVYPYDQLRANITGQCEADKIDRTLQPNMLSFYHISQFNAEYLTTRHIYYLNIPVAVAFRTSPSFDYYKRGVAVMTDCDEEKEKKWHSGVIIGYGSTKNSLGKKVDYWVFKNSWANDWGEDGYGRIIRGENWCDIESHITGAQIPDPDTPNMFSKYI